jgi:hypothetical protein
MTAKALATGVAAVAAIGAAAAGLTSSAFGGPAASQVQPVVFGAPLPLDQTTTLPTAGQLSTVLTSLADPNVPFANKSGLVEGGISPSEAALADHALQKAAKKGQLPLSFGVSNIQAAGPGSATADVAVSGPKLAAPVTQNVTFVNQGSWLLSRDSAMTLLQAASGH